MMTREELEESIRYEEIVYVLFDDMIFELKLNKSFKIKDTWLLIKLGNYYTGYSQLNNIFTTKEDAEDYREKNNND